MQSTLCKMIELNDYVILMNTSHLCIVWNIKLENVELYGKY